MSLVEQPIRRPRSSFLWLGFVAAFIAAAAVAWAASGESSRYNYWSNWLSHTLQVLELLPHALRCLVAVVPAIAEELADQPQPCVTLFVKIDLRVFHAEDAKVDATPDCSDLRQDVMTQVGVQGILGGKMPTRLHPCIVTRL